MDEIKKLKKELSELDKENAILDLKIRIARADRVNSGSIFKSLILLIEKPNWNAGCQFYLKNSQYVVSSMELRLLDVREWCKW